MEKIKSPKHKKIIETAILLFRKYGFRKISVEEICIKAEVSKMTFYKFFRNKQDLIDKIWHIQFAEGMDQFEEIDRQEIPFTEKVKLILKLKEESANQFSKEFVEEYIDTYPEFIKTYSVLYQKALERFVEFIKVHQKKGEVRTEMRPDFFLKVISKMMELAQDKELVNSYNSLAEYSLEINNYIFYGIMPAPGSIKTEKEDENN